MYQGYAHFSFSINTYVHRFKSVASPFPDRRAPVPVLSLIRPAFNLNRASLFPRGDGVDGYREQVLQRIGPNLAVDQHEARRSAAVNG